MGLEEPEGSSKAPSPELGLYPAGNWGCGQRQVRETRAMDRWLPRLSQECHGQPEREERGGGRREAGGCKEMLELKLLGLVWWAE